MLECKKVVQVTCVPAQVLTTTTEVALKGHSDATGDSDRFRADQFGYQIQGTLKSTACVEETGKDSSSDCIDESGSGSISY